MERMKAARSTTAVGIIFIMMAAKSLLWSISREETPVSLSVNTTLVRMEYTAISKGRMKHGSRSATGVRGDVIDNRIIDLGEVKAGTHTVCISVPDAKFVGKQGDIPVSIFFQGLTEGILNNIGIFSLFPLYIS